MTTPERLLPTAAPEEAGSDLDLGPSVSHPFRTLFFGILLIGISAGLFIWCGGLPMIQRFLARWESRKYRRVGEDDVALEV